MDQKILVNELRKIIGKLGSEKGPFSLVMMLYDQPDVFDSRITLFVSALWLNKLSPKTAITLIIKELRNTMGVDQFSKFSKVLVVNTEDTVVKILNQSFGVSGGSTADITNCNFNGLQIDKAIILESNRISVPKIKKKSHN